MNEYKMSTSHTTDLTDFLIKHSIKNTENKENKDNDNTTNSTYTHTRIGDKDLNIYGGSYIIPKEPRDPI